MTHPQLLKLVLLLFFVAAASMIGEAFLLDTKLYPHVAHTLDTIGVVSLIAATWGSIVFILWCL